MMRQHPSPAPMGVGATAARPWTALALSLTLTGLAALCAVGQAEESRPARPDAVPMARVPDPGGEPNAANQASTASQDAEREASPKSDDGGAAAVGSSDDSAGDDLRARAMTPSMAFEQAPGVLGVSNRSKRLEGVRAYATEPLGLTALGLEDVGLPAVNKKDRIEANLGERIRFDEKGDRIPPAAHRLLDGIGRVLAENVETGVEIRVHTDDQGDAGFNRALSQRRADAIRAYLIGRGVEEGRISGVGMGESAPLASTKGRPPSRAERAKNRRVELVIVPREIPETETIAAPQSDPDRQPMPDERPGIDGASDSPTDPPVEPQRAETPRP
jgi:outer membrane protein OmpA-like peptidoglycan-associated protein